jgi:two-component system sensor histidine kinase EvgS
MTIYQWMLPYRDSNGKVVGMIAGWVDVSERQRLLGQLQEAKEEADAANRAKTTFLATMSHEIRTPMNAVIGMIELALKSAEQGQVDRDALEVASVASRSMLELIGDILDIARIESGHLSLSRSRPTCTNCWPRWAGIRGAGAGQGPGAAGGTRPARSTGWC